MKGYAFSQIKMYSMEEMVLSPPNESESFDDARPALGAEQKAAVLRAAALRVAAAVRRQRAESSRRRLGDTADVPVYGAFVSLKRGGKLRSCCGTIGPSSRLGEALDHAADRAATDDPRFPPIAPGELNSLDVDVWILWGPRRVETRGEDRAGEVVIGKHGLVISRGAARGLLLPGVAVEYGFDARTFLEQVCLKAGLPTDAWKSDDAELQVFEGEAIHGRLADELSDRRTTSASMGQSPSAVPSDSSRPGAAVLHEQPAAAVARDVRPPAGAGRFYPGGAGEVRQAVETLFAGAGPAEPAPWSGAMVPHAGWVYSARLAAAVFRRIAFPDRASILCPHHRPEGAAWAVAPHDVWRYPGGEMEADRELARRLAAGVGGLRLDAAAHRDEHAIEVQLPLLAHAAPGLRITGIALGDAGLTELLRFGAEMAAVLRELPETPLLLVSSDMNHFADDAQTRRLDRLALDALETLDPARLYETVRKHRISMCGMAGCVVALETLRQLGRLSRCEMVGYATSADAGGPTDSGVGYAGALFR